MGRRRARGKGRQGPNEADAGPLSPQQPNMPQTQRSRSVSSGKGSRRHNEVDIATNARHAGTAQPFLPAQSPHPCDDVADFTRPSNHNSVTPVLSTSTPEDQSGGMVDDATRSAPKAIEATDKPRGRKREEDSDAGALPTKRTKTDHTPSNSDVHDKSENKNRILSGSPIRNDSQAAASTNGQTEPTFNPGTGRVVKVTNKATRHPPRDLVQDILDGILPEEVSEQSQEYDGPGSNSLEAQPEAEAETDSQKLETSLSVEEQSEDSHVPRDTVVDHPHEVTTLPSTRHKDDQALEALEYLEDPHVQEFLATNFGKRALQVGRVLTAKKFAKGAANKYDARAGWTHSAHESRRAGASEAGLVIEFDMQVTRGDPSPPDPKSTKWAPAPDGATVMSKKTLGIVTTNDEEFKNVKPFTTKSNTDLGRLRDSGKLKHYAQVIRNPEENRVQREEGVYCHIEIDCDDIDDIDLNIPGPRLMATMPSYQLPHNSWYRVVGGLKDRADIILFCNIQKMAAAVAVEQIETSFDQRSGTQESFGRYRNTHATAGDNSTAVPQASSSLVSRSMIDRLTCSRHAYSRRRTPISHRYQLAVVLVTPKSPSTKERATDSQATLKTLREWRPYSGRVSLVVWKIGFRATKSNGLSVSAAFLWCVMPLFFSRLITQAGAMGWARTLELDVR